MKESLLGTVLIGLGTVVTYLGQKLLKEAVKKIIK